MAFRLSWRCVCVCVPICRVFAVVCSTLNHVSLLFSIAVVRFRSCIVAGTRFLVTCLWMFHESFLSRSNFYCNVQAISMIIILYVYEICFKHEGLKV